MKKREIIRNNINSHKILKEIKSVVWEKLKKVKDNSRTNKWKINLEIVQASFQLCTVGNYYKQLLTKELCNIK